MFTIVYDADNDELLITANLPVFDLVDLINWLGNGSGSLTLGDGDFVVDSSTHITIPNALVILNGGTLTQLDFYTPGPALVGIWAGSVMLNGCVDGAAPTITAASTPAAGRVQVDGTGFITAPGGVTDYIVVITAVPNAGYFFYNPTGPNAGLNAPGAIVSWTDTSIVVENFAMSGRTLNGVAAQDVDACFTSGFDVNPDVVIAGGDIITSISSPLPCRIRIDGTGFVTSPDFGPVNSIVFGFTATGDADYTFYDPTGPDAGLNDPGFTIVTWTDTLIEIDDCPDAGFFIQIAQLTNVAGVTSRFTIDPPVEISAVAPNITSVSRVGNNLVIDGTDMNIPDWSALGLFIAGDNKVFSLTQPFVLSYGPTQIVIDIAAFWAFEGLVGDQTLSNVELRDSMGNPVYSQAVGPLLISDPTLYQQITNVTQSAPDEITITGVNFTSGPGGNLSHLVININGTPTNFYIIGSPNFGSNPPGTGFGPLSDTSIALSNALMVGSTISEVTGEDEPATWSAYFDISPDLVMV